MGKAGDFLKNQESGKRNTLPDSYARAADAKHGQNLQLACSQIRRVLSISANRSAEKTDDPPKTHHAHS
jgi:hypothetical protein